MQTIKKCRPLPICSECINKEIIGWLNENQHQLSKDTKLEMREKLKGIKLKGGECIVCGSDKIAEGVIEEVLGVLEENEEGKEIKESFLKSFCSPY